MKEGVVRCKKEMIEWRKEGGFLVCASHRSPSPGYKNSGNGGKSETRAHTAAVNKKGLLE